MECGGEERGKEGHMGGGRGPEGCEACRGDESSELESSGEFYCEQCGRELKPKGRGGAGERKMYAWGAGLCIGGWVVFCVGMAVMLRMENELVPFPLVTFVVTMGGFFVLVVAGAWLRLPFIGTRNKYTEYEEIILRRKPSPGRRVMRWLERYVGMIVVVIAVLVRVVLVPSGVVDPSSVGTVLLFGFGIVLPVIMTAWMVWGTVRNLRYVPVELPGVEWNEAEGRFVEAVGAGNETLAERQVNG